MTETIIRNLAYNIFDLKNQHITFNEPEDSDEDEFLKMYPEVDSVSAFNDIFLDPPNDNELMSLLIDTSNTDHFKYMKMMEAYIIAKAVIEFLENNVKAVINAGEFVIGESETTEDGDEEDTTESAFSYNEIVKLSLTTGE